MSKSSNEMIVHLCNQLPFWAWSNITNLFRQSYNKLLINYNDRNNRSQILVRSTSWIIHSEKNTHQIALTLTLLNKLLSSWIVVCRLRHFKFLSIYLKFGRHIDWVANSLEPDQRLVWFQAVCKGLTIMISRLKVKLYYALFLLQTFGCNSNSKDCHL